MAAQNEYPTGDRAMRYAQKFTLYSRNISYIYPGNQGRRNGTPHTILVLVLVLYSGDSGGDDDDVLCGEKGRRYGQTQQTHKNPNMSRARRARFREARNI